MYIPAVSYPPQPNNSYFPKGCHSRLGILDIILQTNQKFPTLSVKIRMKLAPKDLSRLPTRRMCSTHQNFFNLLVPGQELPFAYKNAFMSITLIKSFS